MALEFTDTALKAISSLVKTIEMKNFDVQIISLIPREIDPSKIETSFIDDKGSMIYTFLFKDEIEFFTKEYITFENFFEFMNSKFILEYYRSIEEAAYVYKNALLEIENVSSELKLFLELYEFNY